MVIVGIGKAAGKHPWAYIQAWGCSIWLEACQASLAARTGGTPTTAQRRQHYGSRGDRKKGRRRGSVRRSTCSDTRYRRRRSIGEGAVATWELGGGNHGGSGLVWARGTKSERESVEGGQRK